MPTTPEDLLAFLDRLGIETATVEHPPLFSVDESRHLRGEIPGAHTKNLFLVDRKDRLFLLSAEESAAIDLKHLHRKIGASGRLSFGKENYQIWGTERRHFDDREEVARALTEYHG